MADNPTPHGTSHREAVEHIRAGQNFALNLPVVGEVTIPPPEQLAYYGGLAVLTAFDLIEWPVALVIAAGHVMANNQRSRIIEELGKAIEDAG
ncbi:MAG TPA: hypothetical protein VL179_07575 [Mycobacterium sp.]|nr:hypothetical protein [Mycobacterium sp.]